MAIARLPVIFTFVLYFTQVFAQAQTLCSCSNSKPNTSLSNLIASDPRIGALISKAKSQKDIANQGCKCKSKGATFTIPQQNSIDLQQYQNLQQQQVLNVPLNSQPLSVNIQPPLGSQNVEQHQPLTQQQNPSRQQFVNQDLQQPLNLKQQPGNLLPLSQQQCLNLQQLRETVRPSLLLQPLTSQKGSQSIPVNNLKSQQASVIPETLASLPTAKGKLQELPSQVTSGALFSNLGLCASPPSVLLNPCPKPSDQNYFIRPQNDVVSPFNAPIPVNSQFQNTDTIPVSLAFTTPECMINKKTQSNSIFIPLNLENPGASQPNPSLDFGYNQMNSILTQLPFQMPQCIQGQPGRITSVPYQPIEVPSPSTQSNQAQSITSQFSPYQPLQIQPVSSAQNEPLQVSIQDQSQPIMVELSQLQSSSSSPQYPTNISPYPSKHGSKSSMKALLPLLFNLLREKNGGCCCPPNYNCGCMNNNNNMQELQNMYPGMNNNYNSNNNFKEHKRPNPTSEEEMEEEDSNDNIDDNNNYPKPQISDGYASQIKYGLPKEKDVNQNCIGSKEIVSPISKLVSKKAQDKKFFFTKDYQSQNYKKQKNESVEYDDDYDDSYENK